MVFESNNAKRGQGAFEYILMLAGLMLVVLLILVILGGTSSGASADVKTKSCYQDLIKNTGCFTAQGVYSADQAPVPVPQSCTDAVAITATFDDGGCNAAAIDCGDVPANLRPSGAIDGATAC